MISAVLFISFLVLMLLGVPVAISILIATLLAMWLGDYNLMLLAQKTAASTRSVPLMAVPFFVLAAALMNRMGITERIFAFATALVGWMRGGLAQVNVVASMIFAGISGAAVADAAGLGKVEIRAMTSAGYNPGFSAAVTLASSTLGPIFPPSIMMLIYAVTAGVSPAAMFLAGVVPGLVIATILMLTILWQVHAGRVACPDPVPFSLRRLVRTGFDGLLSLLTPVIILWGMVGGVATPTEAGVLAVLYALVLGLVYGHLRIRAVFEALTDTVQTSALILYIIGVSSAFSYVLVAEGTAQDLAVWLTEVTDNPVVLLLLVNLLLLVLGCVLETLPALLIAVPVLLPAIDAVGIDRVHFGVVVIFNLLVGIMTPPMGIGLYILTAISNVPIGRLVRSSLPYLIALLAALGVITFIPAVSLALPGWLL